MRINNKKIYKGEKPAKINIKSHKDEASIEDYKIPSPKNKVAAKCPYFLKCGGCQLQHFSYEEQLSWKQNIVENLLGKFGIVLPIIGMQNPWNYRNKANATFALNKSGQIISGIYEENSHNVVPIDKCAIQDAAADQIIASVRTIMRQCKIRPYDEDTKQGLVRHILVKRGFSTGQIMLVLVTASSVFPGRNNFVTAIKQKHPEISTIIMNVNPRKTSVVLGNQERVLYGKGTIEDTLCGCTFRISPKSFYQINPKQTEILYSNAINFASLTGTETVIDAYCGIGTIGLIASKKAKTIIGVEQNRDAVYDAIQNAKRNNIRNAKFIIDDAGHYMSVLAEQNEAVDVVFLDPPRSGSDEDFLSALCRLSPKRVVYISCDPHTQQRDLSFLTSHGYKVDKIQPVDLFPQTIHVEVIVSMYRKDI